MEFANEKSLGHEIWHIKSPFPRPEPPFFSNCCLVQGTLLSTTKNNKCLP